MSKPPRVHLDRKADGETEGDPAPCCLTREKRPAMTRRPQEVTCRACRMSATWQRVVMRARRGGA